jgi:hypothetical protein
MAPDMLCVWPVCSGAWAKLNKSQPKKKKKSQPNRQHPNAHRSTWCHRTGTCWSEVFQHHKYFLKQASWSTYFRRQLGTIKFI